MTRTVATYSINTSVPLAGTSLKSITLLLAAAIVCSISYTQINFISAIAGCAILFYVVQLTQRNKSLFYTGMLFGAASSLILNYWMVPVITHYVKGSVSIGVLCYSASALVLALFFGVQFFLYGLLKVSEKNKFQLLHNTLLFALLWVMFEWVRGTLFSAMPWLSFSIGITAAKNLFLIQSAAFGGVYVLSFFLVSASYLFAFAVNKKKWKFLWVPVSIILLQFSSGALIYHFADSSKSKDERTKISVALIQPALTPETTWGDKNVNELVNRLFSLNAEAIKSKPDLIVWTETTVPWTFNAEDDFVKEILAQDSAGGVKALLGMNSAADKTNELLCNSVYYLDNTSTQNKRYDKQDLLSLVEQPLFSASGNFILPFLAASGMKMMQGQYEKPIETEWGKAGIMLCNESTAPCIANSITKQGASFLVNVGNDSWFSDYFITKQHFYNCRLRAVENRKDIIVNNNMGVAGVINSAGEIITESDGKISGVLNATIFPNEKSSVSTFYFFSLMLLLLLSLTIHKIKTNNQSST
jgi:apolipoprotein N-acyltransferase